MDSLVPVELIEKRIYLIRGHKVMIDRELAELYGVETRILNQAVRRSMKRFPSYFMFSLTRRKIMNLSQIVISSRIKHAPNVFVFTEQGVAMLSNRLFLVLTIFCCPLQYNLRKHFKEVIEWRISKKKLYK